MRGHTEEGVAQIDDEVLIKMTVASKDLVKGTVDYSTVKDDVKVSETIIFEGTKAAVEKELKAFEATLTNEAGDVEKVIEKMDITKA
jgi:K(+)-stimulated pyrophosphate-energized sodium pump